MRAITPRTDRSPFHLRGDVALACLLVLGAAAATGVLPGSAAMAHAQGQAAAIDLPAQPLEAALHALSRQTGVVIAVDAALAAGKQAPALSGRYTPREALDRLLAGSGLVAVERGGAFTLTPAQPAASSTDGGLAPVTVMATALDGTTERTGNWSSQAATIGKTTQSLREIPQSVSVITKERMQTQGLGTLEQVLAASTGVTTGVTDPDRLTYNVRGYGVDTLQFDGMAFQASPSTGGMMVQTDMAMLDRVEVLRGSAGLLQGSGNPSASVNLVRKRPLRQFGGSAGLTVGRWDHYRAEADISSPLVDSGKVRGRLVVAGTDRKSFRQAQFDDRRTVYGVVEADLTPATLLTVGGSYQDQKTTGSWYGLPVSPSGELPFYLPRSTYLGGAWNRWSRNNTNYFAELEHSFASDWKLKASLTQAKMHLYDFRQSGWDGQYDPRTGTGLNIWTGSQYDYLDKQKGFELTASGPVELFGRKHELLFGASKRDGNVRTKGGALAGPDYADVDPYLWNAYAMYEPPQFDYATSTYNNRIRFDQKGVYGMARLHLADPLKLILGARVSWYEYDNRAYTVAGVQSLHRAYEVKREITPYAGLVYELNPSTSLYASYADIFRPQENVDRNGDIIKPVSGSSYEVGIKRDLAGGRGLLTFALFRIDETNRAMTDVDGPSPCPHTTGAAPSTYCSIAAGKTRSHGAELELSGEVVRGLNVFAGYTYNKTRYVRDRANEGLPLSTQTPRHIFRGGVDYRFGGALAGWNLGGNISVQSDAYAASSQRTVRQGGYAVVGLHAGYRITPRTSLSLNVSNLLDRHYFRAVTTSSVHYGEPRNVTLTLRTAF